MDKLNIGLVNADFLPSRGSGQAVYAEKIARGLSVKHQVTVITSKAYGNSEIEWMDNIRVLRIPVPELDPSKWIFFGYQAAQFLKCLKTNHNFDIIHFLDAHVGYAYNGPFVATLHQSFNQRLKGNKGIPYASSLSNLIKRYPYYLFSRFLEKKALNNATAFISVSDAIRSEYIHSYNIAPSKIYRIYNGIDTDFFKPTDSNYLKKIYSLHDEKVLLYVGFTTPRKGIETLAHAMEYLTEKNVKLIIVGKWEKGYRRKFLSYLGNNKEKVIEAGYVDDAEMPAYYSLADIFVLPSLLEGFGFPLVESMACGTPVISTNVGAIPEVVGNCGIVVPPQNPVLLAEKIDMLLLNKPLRNEFIKRSRDWVIENFSENVMIQRTISFYKKAIINKRIQ